MEHITVKAIKRIVSLIIILSILMFLIAPPLIGLWIKHRYTKVIASLNKKNPNVTFTLLRYDVGWFHTKTTLRINVDRSSTSANNNSSIDANVDIDQGPLIYVKNDHQHRYRIALADFRTTIPVFNLTGHSVWHFNDTLTSQFATPSVTSTLDGITVSLKHLQGRSYYNIREKQLKLQLMIDSLGVSNVFNVKNIQYQANLNQQKLIHYGKQTLTINSMTIDAAKYNPVTLNNMTAALNTTLNNGDISMAIHYAVQSISENSLGIRGINMNVVTKNVNAKRLNALLKMLNDQKNQENRQQAMAYQQLLMSGLDLLRHGLIVQVNTILVKTKDGIVSLNGHFTIPKLDKSSTFPQAARLMTADFRFQAPKNWLKQHMISYFHSVNNSTTPLDPLATANATLQQWENQQILTSSGNRYKVHIQYRHGHWLINNKVPTWRPAIQVPKQLPNNNRQNYPNTLQSDIK